MSEKKKVIVLGAGPNGLTAAAYLAQAGAEVTVVEKNVETGGGLTTQELSGFKLNYHATYMLLAELMPPYRDLKLNERGVQFVRPENQVSFLFKDKSALTLYTDRQKSLASVARLAPEESERVDKLLSDCQEMCDHFLIPATYFRPLEPIEQVEALNQSDELGRKCGELGDLAPAEILDQYGIKNPKIKAALLYLMSIFGLDPEEGGMGFLAPIYLYRLTQSALVRGGSHQLSSCLRRAVEDEGGSVIVNNAAEQLLLENSRVVGVKLADGTMLKGDCVISTLNPEQTFLQLLSGETIEEVLREGAENWEWEKWSLFVANIGAIGEPPRYEGYPEEVNRSLMVVMGYETDEDVLAHLREAQEGKLSHLAGHGTVASLFDPLLAPSHVKFGESHTLRFECFAPFDGVDWAKERSPFGQRCLDFWASYAPNIKKANIRVQVDWSPLDIEKQLLTMKKGSIKHGAYTTLQMGYNRPFPECSSYRTPIQGLYLGGASVHPGGMVIMGPGYNAARVVAEDLNIPLWEEPEMVQKAIDKGYLVRGEA